MYKNLKLRNYFKLYIVEWNCATIVGVEKEAFLLFETAVYIALYILSWEMGLRYGGGIAVFQTLALNPG